MEPTPALEQLASVYLNQDWALDYATWEEAVDAFIAESPEDVPALPAEIELVLDAYPSEAELRKYLIGEGSAYRPRPDDGGYRGLLKEIAARVSKRVRAGARGGAHTRLPALEHLTGTYFNQDFQITHGGIWETVAAFMEDEPELAALLPDDIRSALIQYPTEQLMQDYLAGIGCEYRAQPEDNGYRGWLTKVAERVSERLRGAQLT